VIRNWDPVATRDLWVAHSSLTLLHAVPAAFSSLPLVGASIRYNCVHYHFFPLPLREQSVHCMCVQAMTQTQAPAFCAHLQFNLVGERTAGLLFERVSRSSLARNTTYMRLQATRANIRKQTCRYFDTSNWHTTRAKRAGDLRPHPRQFLYNTCTKVIRDPLSTQLSAIDSWSPWSCPLIAIGALICISNHHLNG
jgi:hypothetical protein